jgi:hypothetical protein
MDTAVGLVVDVVSNLGVEKSLYLGAGIWGLGVLSFSMLCNVRHGDFYLFLLTGS